MSDMLQTGAAWLKDKLQGFAAHDVTYTRPGAGSVTVKATVGQQVYRSVDPDTGRTVLFRSDRDFILDPAKLVIGGNAVTPAEGDRILDGADTFEAIPLNGEPCSRPTDGFGKLVRVHTLKVSA
jgi:hypothetical protein